MLTIFTLDYLTVLQVKKLLMLIKYICYYLLSTKHFQQVYHRKKGETKNLNRVQSRYTVWVLTQ